MVNIDIPEKNRLELSGQLNQLLANEYVLYTKTLKYHWNVKGKFFGQLHKFFQDQYEKLAEIIDQVAERSVQLGYPADGTLKEFMNKTSLQEQPGQNPADLTMIKNLLLDHETIIIQIRADINLSAQLNDMGTNNLLCDIIEKHEQMAWMLRAHLEE